tara:strand:- start:1133 stop:2899 length:1767 start_codon:yes stop_codon:yes gene_type:complete
MNFLKSYFASLLGTFSALGLLLVFFLLVISAASALFSGDGDTLTIEKKSVLDLNLNLPLAERNPVSDSFEEVLGLGNELLGLPELLLSIELAAIDEDIEGISLKAEFISAGWAQTHAVRRALDHFKASGKFIYAYADFLSQKSYFLASVADSIFLNPLGNLEFKGLASEVLYYGTFQEKYGAQMEVIREGNFKGAVEPFLQDEMSSENELQIQSVLNSLWSTFRQAIAISRNLNEDAVDSIAETLGASLPEEALSQKLIDGLNYENEVEDKIKTRLGLEEDDEVNWVSPQQMARTIPAYNNNIKDRVAIIFANGNILYGEGSNTYIAQGKFVEAIDDAAQDEWVKAIVLRINSPGGSALTSEIIWEALERAKAKKPLIVSIGNVAASGGYYLAAPAHQIFADPLSITGSIGVFAILPNFHQLSENIGINADQVRTHTNAAGYSPFEPLSDDFRAYVQKNIRKIYSTFKQRVAAGRNLSLEKVESLAQGRVWSGKEALANGLVDALGGLDEAIAAAASQANLKEYNCIAYPRWDKDLESIINQLIPTLKYEGLLKILSLFGIEQTFADKPQKPISSYFKTQLPFLLKIQ